MQEKFLLTQVNGCQTGAIALPEDEVSQLQTIFDSVTYLSTSMCHGEHATASGPGNNLLDPMGDGYPGCVGNVGLKYAGVNKVMLPVTGIIRKGVRNLSNSEAIS